MTRLPVTSWNIKPRLDLPPYELNDYCPVTGEVPEPGSHHIVRRSFTALGKKDNDRLYWVELPNGEVIGNRIRLSAKAHERVTVNKARISYESGVYYWIEGEERSPLRWQPPTMHRRKAAEALVEREETAEWLNSPKGPHIEPGHDCPTCRRRVPLPKKATSPDTKVFSTRVPVADVDTFKEILDAAAEHAGLKPKAHFAYWTILAGLTLILQAPKEDLPDVG